MACSRLILCGALALAGTYALPSVAQACSIDPCGESGQPQQLRVATDTIAADGVLALSAYRGDPSADPADELVDALTITVLGADEQEVPGSLEVAGSVFYWRPDAPLTAGDTLTVSLEAAVDDEIGCRSVVGDPATVTVVEAAIPELALPEAIFSTEYILRPGYDVETTICCDGSMLSDGGCGDTWPNGSDAKCFTPTATGLAFGELQAGAVDPALAPYVAIELLVDGEPKRAGNGVEAAEDTLMAFTNLPRAAEMQLRITSLLDGSTLDSDVFIADGGQPDDLGELTLDPQAEAEATCESQPYSCAPQGAGWDTDECEPAGDPGPWDDGPDLPDDDDEPDGPDGDTDGPGQDDDAATGCRVGGSAPSLAWIALLGLGLLRRRRRSRVRRKIATGHGP